MNEYFNEDVEASSPYEEGRAGRYINKSSKIKAFRNSVTARSAGNL